MRCDSCDLPLMRPMHAVILINALIYTAFLSPAFLCRPHQIAMALEHGFEVLQPKDIPYSKVRTSLFPVKIMM